MRKFFIMSVDKHGNMSRSEASAESVSIEQDGHLVFFVGKTVATCKTVAAYAPGSWVRFGEEEK